MPAFARQPAFDSPPGMLMACLRLAGQVEWIGLSPGRGVTPPETDAAAAVAD